MKAILVTLILIAGTAQADQAFNCPELQYKASDRCVGYRNLELGECVDMVENEYLPAESELEEWKIRACAMDIRRDLEAYSYEKEDRECRQLKQ